MKINNKFAHNVVLSFSHPQSNFEVMGQYMFDF